MSISRKQASTLQTSNTTIMIVRVEPVGRWGVVAESLIMHYPSAWPAYLAQSPINLKQVVYLVALWCKQLLHKLGHSLDSSLSVHVSTVALF